MARDPASGVIRWFAVLMACVFVASGAAVGLVIWGLWRLVRHAVGG